ncbi:unnamed protein product [Phytophthora fragariaefolia]|uniref:Unnamed protein product n=1 Tax=Phytophthora fragariaefolia TaxID=1490495 RepID=A0A9W7CR30_9STRA|nr:unnamed protein product [Phytophthora fragariaefolia]
MGYTDAIISLQAPGLRESHVVDIALDGGMLGDDRCVRANVPFPTTFHVAVYKRDPTENDMAQGQTRSIYQVGVVPGGYFELSLSKRQHRHVRATSLFGQDSMTSIGLVGSKFPLVGKQPGWTRRSYGYHGDDGRFYHGTPFEVRRACLLVPQQAGGTVGCGVRISPNTEMMSVFFTHNGELIASEEGSHIDCEYRSWFPAVGLDSFDARGAVCFVYCANNHEAIIFLGVVDELFEECSGMALAVSEQLQWYDIRDSDGESSEEEERGGDDNNSGDGFGSDMSDDEISARLIMRILAMRQAGMDVT